MVSVSCPFTLPQKSSYKTTPAPFEKVRTMSRHDVFLFYFCILGHKHILTFFIIAMMTSSHLAEIHNSVQDKRWLNFGAKDIVRPESGLGSEQIDSFSLSILPASSCHGSGECVSRLSHSWRPQRASGQGHSPTGPEEVQQRKWPQQLLHSGKHHQGQFAGKNVAIIGDEWGNPVS